MLANHDQCAIMQSHHFAQVWDDTLQQLSWTVANHVVAPKVRRGGGFLVAEILHHLKFQRSLSILWDKTSYQVVQDFRRENIESWEKHQIIWNAGIRACCMLLSHPPREGSFQHVFLTVFASKGSNNQRMKSKVVPLSGFLWIWSVAFFLPKKRWESHLFRTDLFRMIIYPSQKTLPGLLKHQGLRFSDHFNTMHMQITHLACSNQFSVYIFCIYIYIHVTHHRT